MKRNSLLITFLVLAFFSNAQAPFFNWAKSFGGTNPDYGTSIVTDSFDNLYVCGIYQSSVDFDTGLGISTQPSAGLTDGYISKWDSNGNWLWTKVISDSGYEACKDMVIDSAGNLLITGVFSGTVDFDPGPGNFMLTYSGGTDIFVLKLDSNGNFIWAKKMGGPFDDGGVTIAVDPTNNIVLTGYFKGTADFDPGIATTSFASVGDFDIFIEKLDPSGNFLWAKQLGSPVVEEIMDLKIDAQADIYAAGNLYQQIDLDPGPAIYFSSIPQHYHAFLLKLDSNGNFIFADEVSGGYTISSRLDIDKDKSVFLLGYYRDTIDIDPGTAVNQWFSNGFNGYLLKVDSIGNYVWAKEFTGSAALYPRGLVIDPTGSIITTGYMGMNGSDFDPGPGTYNLVSFGASDGYVSALDSAGNFLWALQLRGRNYALSYTGGEDICLDNSGNIYFTGSFRDSVDFDPDFSNMFVMNPVGAEDVFVQKIGQSTLSIHKQNLFSNDIHVFPNPTNSIITIVGIEKESVIEVFNVLGEKAISLQSQNTSIDLNLTELENGIYFIKVSSEKGVVSKKIVKE